MADEKIIFSMNRVGKILPSSNRVILKDICLSFFYGAKIGIIGLNGSGKSTLMKIIAGIEQSYQGEVVWAPGYSVGYLEQEPQMDPEKRSWKWFRRAFRRLWMCSRSMRP